MSGLGIGEIFVAVFTIFVVIGLPVLCVTFLIALIFRRRGGRERDRTQWKEETRTMQEMHDGMARMETRIEALETILLERFGKEKP